MAHIYRELHSYLKNNFESKKNVGLILSGIVGCGKTTLIEKVTSQLNGSFQTFSYSGDDTIFRVKVTENSKFLVEDIARQTSKPSIIFVDEVQKTPDVFDALKIAFDKGGHSFIVSGSNPAFLATTAKKRLQRRAEQIFLLPISLSELLTNKDIIPESYNSFNDILFTAENLQSIKVPKVNKPADLYTLTTHYLTYGGLPLSLLAENPTQSLKEIRLTVERGFELLDIETSNVADRVRTELALLQSQEFTYKNILERTRLRRRDSINKIINDLMNHGYLVRKKPMLLKNKRESYLQIFSYIDPGIVYYLTGLNGVENLGFQLEGYIHARLSYRVFNSVYKSELGYYKPHKLEGDNLRFDPGEIDFILTYGKRVVPIEVKMTDDISQINTKYIQDFLNSQCAPFGIVIYGGSPYIDHKNNILYWPYWMV
jgi:predicted AAA+ superfamily ATPase